MTQPWFKSGGSSIIIGVNGAQTWCASCPCSVTVGKDEQFLYSNGSLGTVSSGKWDNDIFSVTGNQIPIPDDTLTIDTSISGNASSERISTGTFTVASTPNPLGLTTSNQSGLRVVMTIQDLESYYDSLVSAFATATLGIGHTNDNIVFNVSAEARLSGTSNTIISVSATINGDYSLHKDLGTGVITITKNSYFSVIAWQGGNTSSNTPSTVGEQIVDVENLIPGVSPTGKVFINGVDQFASFPTTWTQYTSNTIVLKIRTICGITANADYVFDIVFPVTVLSRILFERYP